MIRFWLALIAFLVSGQIVSGAKPDREGSVGLCRQELDSSQSVLLRQARFTPKPLQTPLAFIENRGQYAEQILFRAEVPGMSVWFLRDAICYQLAGPGKRPLDSESRKTTIDSVPRTDKASTADRRNESTPSSIVRISLIGAKRNPEVMGEQLLRQKSNFFIGGDSAGWQVNVPNYAIVRYRQVYPGIDLLYYGSAYSMEYDFVASPGADPSIIRLHYEGIDSIFVDCMGDLVIETSRGHLIERKPTIYQIRDGVREPILGSYAILDDNTVAFRVSRDRDPGLALVIDPVTIFSTILGGSGLDLSADVTLDRLGNIYLIGSTNSVDFSTADPLQSDNSGSLDVLVVKLSATGDTLLYSTYIGGSSTDYGASIATDQDGNAYIAGESSSLDFPFTSLITGSHVSERSAFVCKLSASGNVLLYSAFFGGSGDEAANAIAVDLAGNAFVVGSTGSGNFPVTAAYQTIRGGSNDAYLVKLNPMGDGMVFGTYLGGSGDDDALDVAINDDNEIYVVGRTKSEDFPVCQPWQGIRHGEEDMFVSKLATTGSHLQFSTFLGGGGYDVATGVALAPSGEIWISGYSSSADFPCRGGAQMTHASDRWDGVVVRLSGGGDQLLFGTYLGGNDVDFAYDIAVSANGDAFVSGVTSSFDFPSARPRDGSPRGGGSDAFVVQLSGFLSGESSLLTGLLLGGSGEDQATAVVVGPGGSVILTGYTSSFDFLDNSHYGSYHGGWDLFVARLVNIICGDVDGNGIVNVADNIYLFFYVFGSGQAPVSLEAADVDCNGMINVSDAVTLGNYVFAGGAAPCAACR